MQMPDAEKKLRKKLKPSLCLLTAHVAKVRSVLVNIGAAPMTLATGAAEEHNQ